MAMIKIDINEIGVFKKASSADIFDGNTVFLVGDYDRLYKLNISEVHNPEDYHKAFTADDGCRYGLSDLYVLQSNQDLINKIHELESKIDRMKNIILD